VLCVLLQTDEVPAACRNPSSITPLTPTTHPNPTPPTRTPPGVANLVEKGYKKISPFFIPYAITNMGGALLAIDTGFMGPNYSISTACATANYAYVSAANHIRQGEADLMVVGGSEAPIIPVGLGGFVACRALSTRNDEPQKASRWVVVGVVGWVVSRGRVGWRWVGFRSGFRTDARCAAAAR